MYLALSVLGAVAIAVWLTYADNADDAPKGPFGGRHVLVIGIDGCRPDSIEKANAPHLKKLIRNGVVTYNAYAGGETGEATLQDTVSGPGWTSISTGVWLNKHGVSNNEFFGARFSQYPHFFQRIKEREPRAYLSSLVSWNPIDEFIIEPVAAYTDFRGKGQGSNYAIRDEWVRDHTISHLRTADPDVVSIHLDQVDGAGHSSGFTPDNPAYLQAISNVDGMIGDILKAIEERPEADKESWLVIVTTDHGGLGTSHGGQSEEERTIFMITSGGNTSPRIVDESPGHTAVPSTVLDYLGIPIDPAWGWEDEPFGLPPYQPSGLSTSVGVNESIVLEWAPAVGISGEGLELLRNGQPIAELPLGASQYIDVLPDEFQGLKLNYQLRVVGSDEEISPLETSLDIPKPISDSLRLHLPLDGNANDVSGNNHLTRMLAQAQSTSGAYGGTALTFSKQDEGHARVEIDITEELQIGRFTDFSISLWVRALESGSASIASNKVSPAPNEPGWLLMLSNGGIQWNLSDGQNQVNLSEELIANSTLQWQHLVLTARRQGNATLYRNGNIVGNSPISQLRSLDSGTLLALGKLFDNLTDITFSIDDFRFWTRSLSSDQIHYLYEQRAGPALWRESHFTFAERFDSSIGSWESDPDEDSRTNLVEYASGKSPKDPLNEGTLLDIGQDNQEIVLSFVQKSRGQGTLGIDYHSGGIRSWVESSPTLMPPQWQVIDGTVDIREIIYDKNDFHTVRWHAPRMNSEEKQRYYRIRYELISDAEAS